MIHIERSKIFSRWSGGIQAFSLPVFLLLFFINDLGCAPSGRNSLRFGLSSAPITFDPRYATDATSSRINRLIYRRLVEFDEKNLPVPGLAVWKRVSPTQFRFTLKESIQPFHDGSLFTSEDVKATLESILNPMNASPHRGDLLSIKKIETPDSRTIDIFLKRRDPFFPSRLRLGILPRKKMEENHSFHNQPVGNGPFIFLSWPEEGFLRIKRIFDGQVFEFLHVKDHTVRVLKLLKGEIDMLQNDLPPELVSLLSKDQRVRVIKRKGSNFTYLGFNMKDSVVGRLGVRKAIAHALNREDIIRYVLGGAARPASALLPPEHWAGNPTLTFYPHDPEKARFFLKEEGFDDQRLPEITYKTSTDPFRIRLATVIQHQLKEVGFQVDVRSYDWGTFYGDIKVGRFQMFSLTWVGITTPDIFHMIFHSESVPPHGANRGRFQNALADQLMVQAQKADDRETQMDLYQQLQELLLEQLPYIPLWYEDHFFAGNKSLDGYQLALDGNYDGLLRVSFSKKK